MKNKCFISGLWEVGGSKKNSIKDSWRCPKCIFNLLTDWILFWNKFDTKIAFYKNRIIKWIGLGCGVHDDEKITMCLSD